jgi:beta-aspartyl-dipeptidase (metallo-type)
LGGKAGILHLHLGDGKRALETVFRIVRETEIPATQIIPTHCNRNQQLLDEALRYAAEDGRVDLTAEIGVNGSGISVEAAVRTAIERGVPLDRISVSSDANGSLVEFDDAGNLEKMGVATQASLLDSLRGLVQEGGLELADACTPFTSNPARFYKLERKGRVAAGADADLLVLDRDLELVHVLARGQRAVTNGNVVLRSLHPTPS